MTTTGAPIVARVALEAAARLFIARGCDNVSLNDVRSAAPPASRVSLDRFSSPTDVLEEIFRIVWVEVLRRTSTALSDTSDPRDALARAFSEFFEVFFRDQPILGKCIILESHRYNSDKIRKCFLIPEVTSFLDLIRSYLNRQQTGGNVLAVNPDALLELFLSILDGIMFAWIIQKDIGYSSKFTIEDFASIARLLVASLLVDATEPSRIYYDAVANTYDNLYTDTISRAEDEIVSDRLAKVVRPGDAVLDLGCGSGLGFALLSRHFGSRFSYCGVDISPAMIRAAKASFGRFSHAKFLALDMADLSYYAPASFDAVISLFGSFSHVLNTSRALAEIRRVLKPSGRLAIMVYSRYSLRNLLRSLARLSPALLAEVHPYEIRKTSGSIFADARFFTGPSARNAFREFDGVSVEGLNCLLEFGPVRRRYLRTDRGIAAKRFLEAESRFLRSHPSLCHSLLVTGIYGK